MVSTLRALASALLGVEGADCWTIEDVDAKKACPGQRHSQCDDKMDADQIQVGSSLHWLGQFIQGKLDHKGNLDYQGHQSHQGGARILLEFTISLHHTHDCREFQMSPHL